MPVSHALKAFRRIVAILFLFMLSSSSWAVPQIDKPYVLQDKWNTIAYARIVWPAESSEQIIHCGYWFGCMLKLCLREITGTDCTSRDVDQSHIVYPYGNNTMKELRQLWVNEYGTISKEFRFTKADTSKCIIMTASAFTPLPGMFCRPLVSPAVYCSISENLNFEYNTLSSDKVDKAEAYGTLTITCNDKTTVALTLAGDRTIDLGRGGTLTASLHTTYRDLADGYSFEGFGMTTNLKITSILHSSKQEADAGPFNGQGVIAMNIY